MSKHVTHQLYYGKILYYIGGIYMNKTENEVWKAWPGAWFIEGSSLGRVRTLDRVLRSGKGRRPRLMKGQILKQHRNGRGYMQVSFKLNGKVVCKRVHRIIAECFLQNPNNYPQVNHKDCNPSNNTVSNLEWCTASYNCQYREKYGISMTEAQGYPLFAINLKTRKISRFQSRGEAGRTLGVSAGNISGVIQGRLGHTGNYWFTNTNGKDIENVRHKFGDSMANKVAELLKNTEMI